MAIGESSQIKNDFCNNCFELKALLDRPIVDVKKSFGNIISIQDEENTLEIKLEVCSVEKDLLDEEIFDLKNHLKNAKKNSNSNKSYKSTSSQSDFF